MSEKRKRMEDGQQNRSEMGEEKKRRDEKRRKEEKQRFVGCFNGYHGCKEEEIIKD